MDSRYILFAGERYYPFGGFEDYVDSADSIGELKRVAEQLNSADWAQIVDMQDRKVVSVNVNNNQTVLLPGDWEEENKPFADFTCYEDY